MECAVELQPGRTKVWVIEEKERPYKGSRTEQTVVRPQGWQPPGEGVWNLNVFQPEREPPPAWLHPFSSPTYLSPSPLVLSRQGMCPVVGFVPPERGIRARDCPGSRARRREKLPYLGPWLREP